VGAKSWLRLWLFASYMIECLHSEANCLFPLNIVNCSIFYDSVCPSVTLASLAKTVKDIELCSGPHHRTIVSCLLRPDFAILNSGFAQTPGRQRQFHLYCTKSWKHCEIGCKLVLFTNKELHIQWDDHRIQCRRDLAMRIMSVRLSNAWLIKDL